MSIFFPNKSCRVRYEMAASTVPLPWPELEKKEEAGSPLPALRGHGTPRVHLGSSSGSQRSPLDALEANLGCKVLSPLHQPESNFKSREAVGAPGYATEKVEMWRR